MNRTEFFDRRIRLPLSYGSSIISGQCVDVAAMPSKMGSFKWKIVESKEHKGFVFALFALAGTGHLWLWEAKDSGAAGGAWLRKTLGHDGSAYARGLAVSPAELDRAVIS